MKTHIPISLLFALLTMPPLWRGARADQLRVVLESAPSPSGPWTREDLAKRGRDAEGNPLLPMDSSRMFFRSVLERSGDDAGPGASIDISVLPPEVVDRVKRWLDD